MNIFDFISARAILLPLLIIPGISSGQRLADSTKMHRLQEVAVTDQKIDNRLLLQKIVTKKRLQFRDTEVAYMLIQENVSNHQFDTLSDIISVNFRNQQLATAYCMPYFAGNIKPDVAWTIAVYSIFSRFVFIKGSRADRLLFYGKGPVTLSSDGFEKTFSLFGASRRLKDTLLYVYRFNDSGSSSIFGYYHDNFEYNKSGEIVYLSDTTSILPYEISIYRHYFNYRLYLRRISIHLDKQEGSEIRITKPLITIFEE